MNLSVFKSLNIFSNPELEKEHEFQSKIAQIVIYSFDPEELKNKIAKEVATTLNASRCFFIDYDPTMNCLKKITNAYNNNRDDASLLGVDVQKVVPSIATKIKYMKSIVVEDSEQFVKTNKLEGKAEDFYFKKYNVKSALGIRLEFGEIFLGVLAVHYDKLKKSLIVSDLRFLKSISVYVSIALYLSTLYVGEKAEKEKEHLLRSIISIMSSDFNLNKVTKKIFEILALIYNAQKVFINIETEGFENEVYSYTSPEFKTNNVIIDTSIYNLSIFDSIRNKVNYIPNTHNFVVQNNLESSEIERHFVSNDIKSLLLLPILYENLSLGLLIIHFNRENAITQDSLDFIKIIFAQLAIAIKQAQDFEKEKKAKERAQTLRVITEKIRSSLDIDETLDFICRETAKVFNVQRLTIVAIPDMNDFSKYDVKREYITSPDIKGLSDIENFTEAAKFVSAAIINKQTVAFEGVDDPEAPEILKIAYSKIGVKSFIAVAIKKDENVWGGLVLSEYYKVRHWSNEEKTLLQTIADQVYIAINQAELHSSLKQIMDKQNAILNNIPYWTWLKDKDSKYILVNKEYAIAKNLTIENFVGKTDFDLYPKEMAETYIKDDKEIMESKKGITVKESKIFIDGKEKYFETAIQPFFDSSGNVIGTVGIAKDITEKKETQIELMRRQEKIIEANKREALLSRIVVAMRSSLDINQIKNAIVTEVGKTLNVDICSIATYVPKEDYFYVDEHSEYRSSDNENSLIHYDGKSKNVEWFINLFKNINEFFYENVDEFINKNQLNNTLAENFLRDYNVKSSYNVAIYYANELLGYLFLIYTNNYKKFDDNELNFLRTIATQAGIALHQANLYNLTQKQAEAEKFNRTIIEILRSSMEKRVIKNLFVKNIGKFFNADRVLFSEYDKKLKIYRPVDKDSEYLSSPAEKSFIGYDWTQASAAEYIQILLEQRELNIFEWDEYIKQNPKSKDFIDLFEDAGVKSSYNFPVLYQQDIMGFFCIEFTRKVRKLSDEEIKSIRNMCSQAGVALYHAELYLQAKETLVSKEKCITNVSEGIEKPIEDILEKTKLLSHNGFEPEIKNQYYETIINNCNHLLEITKEITNS